MKAGIAAFEGGRVAVAEFSEHAGDLLAEARAEYDEEHKRASNAEQTASPSEVVKLRESSGRASREAVGS